MNDDLATGIRRSAEMAAVFMIGDGVLGLLQPDRHVDLWRSRIGAVDTLVRPFGDRPGRRRVYGILQIAAGIALAAAQRRPDDVAQRPGRAAGARGDGGRPVVVLRRAGRGASPCRRGSERQRDSVAAIDAGHRRPGIGVRRGGDGAYRRNARSARDPVDRRRHDRPAADDRRRRAVRLGVAHDGAQLEHRRAHPRRSPAGRDRSFAFVRHPIYVALFLLTIAIAVAYGHLTHLVIGIPLFAIGTWLRIGEEERLLRAMFGRGVRGLCAAREAVRADDPVIRGYGVKP